METWTWNVWYFAQVARKLFRRFCRIQVFCASLNVRNANAFRANSSQTLQLAEICNSSVIKYFYCDHKMNFQVEDETQEEQHIKLGEETAITDIDPEYFTALRSRPFKERFCRQSFLQDTKEILRNELLTRQIDNKCFEIDREIREGEEKLGRAEVNYSWFFWGNFFMEGFSEKLLLLKLRMKVKWMFRRI